MKKFLFGILILFLLGQPAFSQTLPKNITVTLVPTTTPQTLTGSWASAGSEITIKGFHTMAICTQLAIGNSVNFRVRVLYKIATGGTTYYSMILNPSASVVAIEPEYYELNIDTTGNYCFDVGLKGMNYAQVQVMVGTVGSPTAASITAMYAQLNNE